MNKVKSIMASILPVLPIILIEWRYFDAASKYFVFWTVVNLYFSLSFYRSVNIGQIPLLYANIIAASTQASYLFAAADARFIHVSDDIPMLLRYKAAAIYSVMIILKISITSALRLNLLERKIVKSDRIVFQALSLIYGLNAIILLSGQILMKSKISLFLALPGTLFSLLWSVESYEGGKVER
ncbi:MAG: hypothetical protein N2484_00195 [Clostridia bacterium]|nr:hypothetical protein [Clostridia bacterium]